MPVVALRAISYCETEMMRSYPPRPSEAHQSAAFTLVELMVTVAIIAILASIVIPKFSDMIRKAQEGSTKGTLGGIRSALSVYYADMEGQYPSDMTSDFLNPKYFAATTQDQNLPWIYLPPYHNTNNLVSVFGGAFCPANMFMLDNGMWGYAVCTRDTNFGIFWISCSHTDSKGTVWTSY